jgi:hypothetical protein
MAILTITILYFRRYAPDLTLVIILPLTGRPGVYFDCFITIHLPVNFIFTADGPVISSYL